MVDTWDETKPAGSRNPKLGDDDIREFKRAVRERLAADHEFEASESPAFGASQSKIGHHKWIRMIATSSPPSTLVSQAAIFVSEISGIPEIFARAADDGTVTQLTTSGCSLLRQAVLEALAAVTATAGEINTVADGPTARNQHVHSNLGVLAGAGMTGGGDLTTSITLAHDAHTGDVTGTSGLTIANDIIGPSKLYTGFAAVIREPQGGNEITTGDTSWDNVMTIPFIMPVGPTSLNGKACLKNSDGGQNAYCRFGIGGSYSGQAVRNADSYSWTAFAAALDVSGLTPGTEYTLNVYLYTQGAGDTAYLNGIHIWWV